MKFKELDLMEVSICKENNIKKEVGLTTTYYPLHDKVEYSFDSGVKEVEFFTEEEMSTILTTLLFKESSIDGEYVDDVEELCTLKAEDCYIFTLYYILEDTDFAFIRSIKVHESEIEKTLKKK